MKYTIPINNLDTYAILECCNCSAKVKLFTVLQQYELGYQWRKLPIAGKLLCGHCAHEIFDEHDVNDSKFTSITCKCGRVIQ